MITLDLRETLIPFSLLQISNAFRQMKPGEEMEILTGARGIDAAIVKEIKLILPPDGYDLHFMNGQVENDFAIRLKLTKSY